MNTSRIDRIITELERLQSDAGGIIDTYVASIANRHNASFGATKAIHISGYAGSQLNYVAALKRVRDYLNK
jgi:hypothetical protein